VAIGGGRQGDGERRGRLTGLIAAVGFVLWRARSIGTRPVVFPDSSSYRHSAASHTALVSLVGHAPRDVLVPAFFALLGSDQARVYGQWAVSTLSWLVLAYALAVSLRSVPARVVGVAGVLALGGVPQTWNWDFTLLSESLSTSLAVLVLAAALRTAAAPSRWHEVSLGTVLVLWVAARVDVGPAVLVAAVALGVLAARRRQWSAAMVPAVALLAVAWGGWTTTRLDASFQKASSTGLSYSQELFAYELHERVLTTPAALAYFRSHGMPACPGVTTSAAAATASRLFFARFRHCRPLRGWATKSGRSTLLSFVVSHPPDYLRWLSHDTGRLATGAIYVPEVRSDWRVLSTLFYGGRWLSPLADLAVLLAAGLLAALAVRPRQPGAAVTVTALVNAVAALVGLLAGQLLSAGEVERSTVPEGTLLRLAPILLVAAAVDHLRAHSPRRSPRGHSDC